MQMENLALLRQKVVLNAQPLHGFQMAANNGRGNQLANFSRFIAAALNIMQGLQTEASGYLYSLHTIAKPAHRGPSSNSRTNAAAARQPR